MKAILITGIGGDIGQGVACIIRQQWPDVRLIGIDMHERHGGTIFVDEFIMVPAASTPGYLDILRDIMASLDVDVMIPITEPELSVIGPLLNELGENRCVTAGKGVLQAGLDKLETVHALKKLGLPAPWTCLVDEEGVQEYPCILKGRFGSGSRDICVVNDAGEADYLANKYPDAVFQELLEPDDREVTCAVYRRRDGAVADLLLLRQLTGGYTGWAKVIKDDATSQMCKTVADGLELCGSMNIQLRMTNRGPRVFEINPRFSSTALMRHKLGFSDVVWALDEAEGNNVHFPVVENGIEIVRTQGASILHENGANT